MRSQTVLTTGRAYNVSSSGSFYGPALLSCSKILTYQLLGSQLWTALPLEKSRSPATANKANSRTKLRVKLSHDQNRDNIEFYLHCKFQSLPFCVRRRNGVTDRVTDSAARLLVSSPDHTSSAYWLLWSIFLAPEVDLSWNLWDRI